MSKSISILDKDYLQWVQELCKRYRQSQIKAAMHVNKEVLNFYWELGRDIVCREEENRYGSKFYATLSKDLRHLLPDADGLSERNLRYTKKFYLLYNESVENLQQAAASSDGNNHQAIQRAHAKRCVTKQHHSFPYRTGYGLRLCGQGIPLASGRNGELHRLAFLQSQSLLLRGDRG